MAEVSEKRISSQGKLLVLVFILVLVNTAIIIYGYLFITERLSGSDVIFAYKKELARDLSEHGYRLSNELGVYNSPSVREALAGYSYEVELASSSDELIQVIMTHGSTLHDVILRAADTRLKDEIVRAVNNDSRVISSADKAHLYISIADGDVIFSPEHLIEPDTMQTITSLIRKESYPGQLNIDLEISDGVSQIVIPQSDQDQIATLTEDLNTLRARVHEIRVQAGFAEMVGPGISLLIYDAVDSTSSSSLVHDADIRDIVNELFSAGAQGISVGGQRLTATSAIRCSGPLVIVNYQQISTNPIVIDAIGDPALLISGLQLITTELERSRGLVFEISYSGFIKLAASAR